MVRFTRETNRNVGNSTGIINKIVSLLSDGYNCAVIVMMQFRKY
jgi:hypothetical protein